MTNNWTDIGNASLIIAMGANPAENHPASFAHINKARAKGAKLIVIDPRQTRTARQADAYVRIRPGTDIAFINGLLNYIVTNIEARPVGDPVHDKFLAFLNQTGNGTFYSDGDATHASLLKSAVPRNSKYTDARFIVNGTGTDYVRETVAADTGLPLVGGETADNTISNLPKKADTVTSDPNTVYNRLKAHVAPYTAAVVADICGCTQADIATVGDAFIGNSRCSSAGTSLGSGVGSDADPNVAGYKCTTMLYAMGITQHTCGSQNVKSFAVIQTLMGNMGRAGGGINALRGIHNVQGSTDMGLLYGNIPGYSANPATQPSVDANAFGKYMDALWGYPMTGTGTRTSMNGSYDDAYVTAAMSLQQRGFYNMTLKWFGDYSTITALTGSALRAAVDSVYSLWPKGPGDDHITMFRQMGAGVTKAAVVWGQNPAVTEPNQSAVRTGLENLDLLVVADMFETETAACKRKATGVTYLIPASSHVEEAGSATNSARALQWRERATTPRGNSKADLELLLRLAYALDTAGAFSHIKSVWTAAPLSWADTGAHMVYDKLYGTPYGWTPGAGAFESVAGTAERWAPGATAPVSPTPTLAGSEVVAEKLFREYANGVGGGGTVWIYTGGFNSGGTWTTDNKAGGQAAWQVQNRAKSRDNANDSNTLAYHGWGYSWLVNRRVLYNNGEIPGDVADFFMGPDSVSRLFVSTRPGVLNYSRWYRTIHMLSDKPDVALAGPTAQHILPGRFPAHTEPYETPRADLAAVWGRNTKGTAQWDLVKSDTAIAGRQVSAATYPLVLTTIRCVEHFQGGPITRNNPWNVEAEPEPWIEINPVDARANGINNGDLVNVVTARSGSTTDEESRTNGAAGFAKGFRARVDSSIAAYQRVAPGVVAIPWHWGDRGLSTGSRANDLTVDAGDANTAIPEYKACLCRIEKA